MNVFEFVLIFVTENVLDRDSLQGPTSKTSHCSKMSSRRRKKERNTSELPGHEPLVVNVVVVGLFEEEEEGTGMASDVVKVEGEDPDNPGYLRGDRARLGRRRSWIVGVSSLVRS